MKKRNWMIMGLSLCLVAIIAVGGTLAYFTDKTNTVTNTFTVGEVDITLWESTTDTEEDGVTVLEPTVIGGGANRTYTGIVYERVLPGDRLSKRISVSTSPDSVLSYLAVRLWVDDYGDTPLTTEQKDIVYDVLEASLTRNRATCKSIPQTVDANVFTEPTTTNPTWTAFRLDDGSILMVYSGLSKRWEDQDGDGIQDTQVEFPAHQVPNNSNLQLTSMLDFGKGINNNNDVDGSTYGNEIANMSFQIKAEAFAIQADHLPTKYNKQTVTSWEWFAHTVVDTCNGDTNSIFHAYKPDDPFNEG